MHLTALKVSQNPPKHTTLFNSRLSSHKPCLPEDDVTVRSNVLPPVDGAGPLSSGPDTKHDAAAVREGLEVPLLRLKHVLDAVRAHGHHHLCAGLGVRESDKFHSDGKRCQLTNQCCDRFVYQYDTA